MKKRENKIKIIGCGSLLMGDDAVGCVIARKLIKMDFPDFVEIIEAGTPGLDLLNMMEPGERVIIVDAVITGKNKIGGLSIYTEDDLPKPSQMPLSAHHVAIPDAIELGRKLQPEMMPASIEIWGIEVKAPLIKKMEMSEKIEAAVRGVIDKLTKEIINYGESKVCREKN